MHGTIKVGHRTIHGVVTRIPEDMSAQERLAELRGAGTDARLVSIGDNEHRIFVEDPSRVRIPRGSDTNPEQDGQL